METNKRENFRLNINKMHDHERFRFTGKSLDHFLWK